MVGQFGSREICDVTFKSLVPQTIGTKTFKAGQPVFIIDTATTSNMEQATTTVYAQGGKGYNRLIAWEGEKTMTFTVTDALMSPMGLKVLSGAGFAKDADVKHIHVTYDTIATFSSAKAAEATIDHSILANELGVPATSVITICNDDKVKPYATILDSFGGVADWCDSVTFVGQTSSADATFDIDNETKKTQKVSITMGNDSVGTYKQNDAVKVKLDFYVVMTTGASEITVAPGDFGGNFYVEADTLYRNRAGKDMAATLTFPNVKVQSGFTIAMAANGDPSTFDFVMDALPGYTYFDSTKKVVCDITIVSGDSSEESNIVHSAMKSPDKHEQPSA